MKRSQVWGDAEADHGAPGRHVVVVLHPNHVNDAVLVGRQVSEGHVDLELSEWMSIRMGQNRRSSDAQFNKTIQSKTVMDKENGIYVYILNLADTT